MTLESATLPLCSSVIYGPIHSRRYGTSLGINLLPADLKLCSFDCGYCQYGRTPPVKPHAAFPTPKEAAGALREALRVDSATGKGIDWIMIAGHGEPTLHPDFAAVTDALLAARDASAPRVPVGILSNGSTLRSLRVRAALHKLDGRFMKWDAGNAQVFSKLNGANERLWHETFGGLRLLGDVTLQSMFVSGVIDTTEPGHVKDWIETVARIRPKEVQIYTIDRLPADRELLPVSGPELHRIGRELAALTGIHTSVY